MKLLYLFAAGGVGTVLRYLVAQIFAYSKYPLATLLVNFLGCIAIAYIAQMATRNTINEDTRLLLATGLCGGFTTYSAFALESSNLLKSGAQVHAIIYVLATVLLGFIGIWLGDWLAKFV